MAYNAGQIICPKSAHPGVSWHSCGKWQARSSSADGGEHYLGLFATEDEASTAVESFRAEHGGVIRYSAEWKQKIAATRAANGLPGPRHPNWKEDAGYAAIHHRIARRWKKAGVCERCSAAGRTHWANLDGAYDWDDRSTWAELCSLCHARQDAHRKPRGEAHHNAVLTVDNVIAIRQSSESYAALGRRYGVAANTIVQVVKRRTWRHVP